MPSAAVTAAAFLMNSLLLTVSPVPIISTSLIEIFVTKGGANRRPPGSHYSRLRPERCRMNCTNQCLAGVEGPVPAGIIREASTAAPDLGPLTGVLATNLRE
jgi:hypothetical protein